MEPITALIRKVLDQDGGLYWLITNEDPQIKNEALRVIQLMPLEDRIEDLWEVISEDGDIASIEEWEADTDIRGDFELSGTDSPEEQALYKMLFDITQEWISQELNAALVSPVQYVRDVARHIKFNKKVT